MHVAFLMLAHVPYLRRAGRRPRGEEGLHTLVAQGLLPLLELLGDLHSSGLHPRIGLACSPLLVDQLADPVVQKHFVLWMHDALARREAELAIAERDGDHHGAYLGRFYLEWGRQRLRSFEERFQRNLPRAIRELAAARVIEPLAVPATYAYLPLLGREESVRAQIEQGVLQITRHLWRPEGLWLPGAGWRPGVEGAAADAGLRYLVADPSCCRPHRRRRPSGWPDAALPPFSPTRIWHGTSGRWNWATPAIRCTAIPPMPAARWPAAAPPTIPITPCGARRSMPITSPPRWSPRRAGVGRTTWR